MQGTVTITSTSAANVTVDFTLTNNRVTPINFCKFGTPLEKLCGSNVFVITNVTAPPPQTVRYAGIMARRTPPDASSFVTMANGAFTKFSNVIGKSYSFVAGQTYEIQVNGSRFVENAQLSAAGYVQANNTTVPVTLTPVQFTAT